MESPQTKTKPTSHELDHDHLRGEVEGDYMWPIGQVRSQVWCRPYLAVHFSFFDQRTFPWPLSKVQVSKCHPFTLKAG